MDRRASIKLEAADKANQGSDDPANDKTLSPSSAARLINDRFDIAHSRRGQKPVLGEQIFHVT